ncbi:deoxyribodipyrimidine photo-lyase [Shimia isoporae]|uniref:Deoxyribodipyrimidine photo-lyase n=1 Tax=Shimia isoporae TaxID=647720 RepID=A0A4R1NNW8_9RHOB|nr:deoxyribodipyrimidine photo-lyase [Shimia isoporae]TCL09519.1 deoxyribodipyrimidine photo-lyase [Shimia isoporae]
MSISPISIYWVRRDFRLTDNAALTAAIRRGSVLPVFICDPQVESLGAAPKFRLDLALAAFEDRLGAMGSKLVMRRGKALDVLQDLARESGATAVYWNRLYDPSSVARDTDIKASLKADGLEVESFTGALMFEPWTVKTKTDGPYRVYTPFWKAVREVGVPAPLKAPDQIPAPETWPHGEARENWKLSAEMRRGADVVRQYVRVGEPAAQARLAEFCEDLIAAYKAKRDYLDAEVTSELSDALSLGEISPAQCWHAGRRRMQEGAAGAEHFLKEVVWREFAWHLMWHYPEIETKNWRPEWDGFSWIDDEDHPHFLRWCQGRTGQPLVDAAMRELYVTGKMHNRARMITASYLTKHLGIHWRLGMRWFEDCLVDWDPASNAMGWQWVAGSGPDAAPYFRIYNPQTQSDKFDPEARYLTRWLPDEMSCASESAIQFFDAIPVSWGLKLTDKSVEPLVDLAEGRARALAAYETFKTQ